MRFWLFFWGLLALGAASVVALVWGLDALTDPQTQLILWDLRVPRIVTAIAVGSALALSGVILQALFSNPLCEPYTLGISSGGALGAVLGLAIGFPLQIGGVSMTALIGSLLFSILLQWIALQKKMSQTKLLLSGVMLGLIGSSLISVWMALGDPSGIQSAIFWLMGDLSRASGSAPWISLVAVLILSAWAWSYSDDLDLLLLGENEARSLGVDPDKIRSKLLLIASLLVGLSVALAGMIGFVGLVIPHFVRALSGPVHRVVVPTTLVWGALAIVVADFLCRLFGFGSEIPVGVATALLGAPVFMRILWKRVDSI